MPRNGEAGHDGWAVYVGTAAPSFSLELQACGDAVPFHSSTLVAKATSMKPVPKTPPLKLSAPALQTQLAKRDLPVPAQRTGATETNLPQLGSW